MNPAGLACAAWELAMAEWVHPLPWWAPIGAAAAAGVLAGAAVAWAVHRRRCRRRW